MIHKIKTVKPLNDLTIEVVFRNGVEVQYDIKQLYDKFPQFIQLERLTALYEKVKVDVGGYGIVWNDELDLDAEEIWRYGIRTGNLHDVDIKHMVAERLIEARSVVGMTQKQLADATLIYQGDISKIENAVANPSVQTLQRLADGMGMQLEIEFIPRK